MIRFAIALAIGLATPLTGQDPVPLLARHLDLDLTVHYETRNLEGTATWVLENVGPDPVSEVPLQIGRLMTARAATSGDSPVSFIQDVVVYEDWPRRQVTQLRLFPDSPLAPRERRAFTLSYSGPLVPSSETGMRYVKDDIDRSFTLLRSESFAFPQLAQPSLAANRKAPREDFTYRLRITAPSDLIVATGVPESSKEPTDSLTTWEFETGRPVPFLNIGVAPYEVISADGLTVFHFPEDKDGAARLLKAMVDAIALYENWFGPHEGGAAVHVIEIPSGWGSQASITGGIILTADAFENADQLEQLYHELAHLWHPADLDRPAPRWNEGLATFLQYRVASTQDASDLGQVMERLARSQLERFGRRPELSEVAMIDYGRAEATGFSYGTGALMFYALFRTLGEAEFDALLGEWFRQYRADGSSTRQLVELLLARSGPGVETLLQDWLFSADWHRKLQESESLDSLISTYRVAD
jgi:aminopeptidase N